MSEMAASRKFVLWRPGRMEHVRSWLLGNRLQGINQLQGALQLTLGAFIVALFTLVRSMTFNQACTTMTLYIVMSVLVPQDLHMGSKILGSCLMVGAGTGGVMVGGALVSAAKAVNWSPLDGQHDRQDYRDYVVCYMLLSAVGLAILAINRVGADPPFLWAVGMISCLMYGIVVNAALFYPPRLPGPAENAEWLQDNRVTFLWKQLVARVLLDLVIAQACAIFSAVVMLPSSASEELRANLSKAVQGIGYSVSKYTSKLFEPDDPHCLYIPPSKRSGLPGAVPASADASGSLSSSSQTPSFSHEGDDLFMDITVLSGGGPEEKHDIDMVGLIDEELDEEEFLKLLRESTMPPPPPPAPGAKPPAGPAAGGAGGKPSPGVPQPAPRPPSALVAVLKLGPPVASYRALLGRARALMPFAMIEPPFLTGYTFHSNLWGRVLGAAEVLLTRVSGLETVLDERRQALGDKTTQCFFAINVVPPLRLVYAEVAATCATLSTALDPRFGKTHTMHGRMIGGCLGSFGRSWAETRKALQDIMSVAIRNYLGRVRDQLHARKLESEGGHPKTHVHIMDASRMRAITYAFSLTMGVIEAMEELERAVHAVVVKDNPAYAKQPPAPSSSQQAVDDDVLPFPPSELKASAGVSATEPDSTSGQKGLKSDGGPVAESLSADLEAGLMVVPAPAGQHSQRVQASSGGVSQAETSRRSVTSLNIWGTRAPAAGKRSSTGAVPVAEGTEEPLNVQGHEQQIAQIKLGSDMTHKAPPAAHELPSGTAAPPAKGSQAPLAGPGPTPPKPPPHPVIMSIIMAVTAELGAPLWGGLAHFVLHDFPSVFKPGGFKAALRSRVFQTYVKYYACLLIIMMLILGLSARDDTTEVRVYRPYIAFTAAALSMSEKVESTVSKAVLWLVGTVVGGTMGYMVMFQADLANNVYGIMAVICAFTFLVGANVNHQYKVLITLCLMSFNDVILCQFALFPRPCSTCTVSDQTYGARVLSVIMGVTVALLISNLVLPWYNSEWCLEVMGGALKQTHSVLQAAYSQYYHEGQQALHLSTSRRVPKTALEAAQAASVTSAAASHSPAVASAVTLPGGTTVVVAAEEEPGAGKGGAGGGADAGDDDDDRTSVLKGPAVIGVPAGPPLPVLQAKIAGPLTGVQISLIKDTTFWQRGYLATPPIVPRLLMQNFQLLDRLSALVVMLRPGIITGTFSGSAFQRIAQPMHPHYLVVLERLGSVMDACARILQGDHSSQAQADLVKALDELEDARVKIRAWVIAHRRSFHLSLADLSPGDPLPYERDPDDLIRVLSYIHASIKICDKAMMIARMVAGIANREACRSNWIK